MSKLFDELHEQVTRRDHYRTQTANHVAQYPLSPSEPIELMQFTDALLVAERAFHDGIRKGFTTIGKGHMTPHRGICPVCGSPECLEAEYFPQPSAVLIGVIK